MPVEMGIMLFRCRRLAFFYQNAVRTPPSDELLDAIVVVNTGGAGLGTD
eukprot:COSAG02_NODE_35942_length_461_cov_0.715470_1_plen_48_part_10